MADIIQWRRGTAAAWTSANPVLASGELGLETDTFLAKAGDGVTAWNSLSYNFVGPPGPQGDPGSVWYTGSGAPAGGLGIEGDFYLDSANGDYYEKTGASTWTLQGNLQGPAGPKGDTGLGVPPGTTVNASIYFDGVDWLENTGFRIQPAGNIVVNDTITRTAGGNYVYSADGTVVNNIVLTQAAYDALTPVATTIYNIVG